MDSRRLRRAEVQRKVGSLAVVVIDVMMKNQLQVALAKDEQPVQSLVTQLAMGVGSLGHRRE
jgi:hypothetical protein